MTIELPEETGRRLHSEAAQSGQSVAEFIERLLAVQTTPRPLSLQDPLSPQDFIRELRRGIERRPQNLPVLSDDALSRESIYDRDSPYEGQRAG